MMNLVYMRMMTQIVATDKQTMLQARLALVCAGEFRKSGMTPGGGSKPGP